MKKAIITTIPLKIKNFFNGDLFFDGMGVLYFLLIMFAMAAVIFSLLAYFAIISMTEFDAVFGFH